MVDATLSEAEAVEGKTPELTPEQQAQQQAQMLEMEIARGKRMLTITCLNLANMAINTLPRPEQDQEETPKSKKNAKNPAKRTLTLADLDKVSVVVERFTQASAHLSSGNPMMGMNPMMMRGR